MLSRYYLSLGKRVATISLERVNHLTLICTISGQLSEIESRFLTADQMKFIHNLRTPLYIHKRNINYKGWFMRFKVYLQNRFIY